VPLDNSLTPRGALVGEERHLSRYQVKLRKLYAIVFNYSHWEEVPDHLKDATMEESISRWMSGARIFR
jgi:hypothetical protein